MFTKYHILAASQQEEVAFEPGSHSSPASTIPSIDLFSLSVAVRSLADISDLLPHCCKLMSVRDAGSWMQLPWIVLVPMFEPARGVSPETFGTRLPTYIAKCAGRKCLLGRGSSRVHDVCTTGIA